MTTFETELEHEKAEKIKEVASRGAAMAAELGHDGEAIRGFLRHYFRHVDAVDVDERSVEDLLGLVISHYRAGHAPAGRPRHHRDPHARVRPTTAGRPAGRPWSRSSPTTGRSWSTR